MASNDRLGQFKNKGRDLETNRNRRKDDIVELRKARKEEQWSKRRNIHLNEEVQESDDIENHDPTSPVANGQPLALQSIEKIVEGLHSADRAEVFRCANAARRVLSREKNPPIDEFIHRQALPRLVQLLQVDDDSNLQLEVAWALTNIASGSSEQTKCVVNAGACPHFTRLLKSPNRNVSEQAVWAIANIAGDGSAYRDMIIGLGVIPALTHLIKVNKDVSFLGNVAWCFSNLCRNRDPPPSLAAIRECAPSIRYLLMHKSIDVISDACWSLSYISDGSDERIQVVVDMDVIERLIEIITTMSSKKVLCPALRTLGNIVTGTDHQTQAVIDRGILPAFKFLLEHESLNLRKDILWALSNITAGNKDQIQAVIDAGLPPFIIDILKNGEAKLQTEATWAITNLTCGGTHEQMAQIVAAGCIPPLVAMLNVQDAKITSVILEAFKNFLAAAEDNNQKEDLLVHLEEIGFVDHLERLQTHENEDIYNMAEKLIMDNWGAVEDDGEVEVSTTNDGHEYAFQSQNNAPSQSNFDF